MSVLDDLLGTLPQRGRITWIGVRPARGVPTVAVESVEARPGEGLTGDRFKGTPASRRQVTLIQAEHLAAVGSFLDREPVEAALTRRNLVVTGINLYALRHARFSVGSVVLEGTGICTPCEDMEDKLGPGAFNAMRGHGGITARVLEAGVISLGDAVALVSAGPLGAEER